MKKYLKFRLRFIFIPLFILVAVWIVTAQPIFLNSSIVVDSISPQPEALIRHVKKLSEEFVPRHFENIENLDKTANYIKKEFLQFTPRVKMQIYEANGKKYQNVIAEFGPTQGGAFVVGAHYDACNPLPGADDNASGVAGLIELGRLLATRSPPNLRVILVTYTLEEPPYFSGEEMGSVIHAKSLAHEKQDISGMISLEMIGYFSNDMWSQSYPIPLLRLFYPSRGNYIAVVSDFGSYSLTRKVKGAMQKASSLPVYSINALSIIPGIDWSDHRSYWKQGIPAVMVTDTSFFRNKAYHTQYDTYEKLDYDKMSKTVSAVYNSLFN